MASVSDSIKALCIAFLFCLNQSVHAEDVVQAKRENIDFERVLKQASEGGVNAQFMAGKMLFEGEGVAKDRKAACSWWVKAAEQGSPEAQHHAGACYHRGFDGFPQDYGLSLNWYTRAFNKSYGASILPLALQYFNGEGVPKNFGIARRILIQSPDPESKKYLNEIYNKGLGEPTERLALKEWLAYGAEKLNHPKAALQYAKLRAEVGWYDEKGLELLRIAADGGLPEAQFLLGNALLGEPASAELYREAEAMLNSAKKAAYPGVDLALSKLISKKKDFEDQQKEILAFESSEARRQQDAQRRERAREGAARAREAARIDTFRKKLGIGAETNCGPVIDGKATMLKVYFPVMDYGNEHWIPKNNIFPPDYACNFLNGRYQVPSLRY